jgi:hypothetical protein
MDLTIAGPDPAPVHIPAVDHVATLGHGELDAPDVPVRAASIMSRAKSSPCVEIPIGGMSYLPASGQRDAEHRPEVLLYEPQKNGKLELIGVEFVVPPALWAGSGPPELGDQTFGNNPYGNYALHAWVWRHNPNGMYANFNPRVSCAYAP